MRVRMLTLEAGPSGTFPIGSEREVSDEHGRQLVAGRYAVDITPPVAVIETASLKPAEVATVAAEEVAAVAPVETRGRRRK